MGTTTFRNWSVLCWNVRGLNSDKRQRAVSQKIQESQCSVVCLQETKMQQIYHRTIRTFSPKKFDNFAFRPLVGASGGIVVIWN